MEDLLQAGVGTLETRPLPVALERGRFSDALASCFGTAQLPAAVLAPPQREEAGCRQQAQTNLDALVCLCGRVLMGNRIPGPDLCVHMRACARARTNTWTASILMSCESLSWTRRFECTTCLMRSVATASFTARSSAACISRWPCSRCVCVMGGKRGGGVRKGMDGEQLKKGNGSRWMGGGSVKWSKEAEMTVCKDIMRHLRNALHRPHSCAQRTVGLYSYLPPHPSPTLSFSPPPPPSFLPSAS